MGNVVKNKIVDYGTSYLVVEPKIYKIASKIVDNLFEENEKIAEIPRLHTLKILRSL